MARRHPTIHDLTTLRVHPDGSLVRPPTSSPLKRKKTGHRAVIDNRGNWIANDAGGTSTVARRTSRTDDNDDDDDDAHGDDDDGDDIAPKRKAKRRRKDPKSSKALKRQKFRDDLAFLDSPSCSNPRIDLAGDESGLLPVPCSDLLKWVHHFASNYYTKQGRLDNVMRKIRAEKKAKRRAKLAERDVSISQKGNGSEPEDEKNEGKADAGVTRKGWNARMTETQIRDMYRSMDGSALVVIGMLIQEHIAALTMPCVPDKPEGARESPVGERGGSESGRSPPSTPSTVVSQSPS